MTHPTQRPGQSFEIHQQDMADWMGCSVERMNAEHDQLHLDLCAWLGIEHSDSVIEEEAVLYVQRLICHGI